MNDPELAKHLLCGDSCDNCVYYCQMYIKEENELHSALNWNKKPVLRKMCRRTDKYLSTENDICKYWIHGEVIK
jgi:uncharacterized C2H2 Zn-finger protein